MSLMEKIFGDLNEKEVKKVSKIADKVMSYDEEFQKLTDGQLREKTEEFKKRIAGGESLDDILPEAFAVCRGCMAKPRNEAFLRTGNRGDSSSSGKNIRNEDR